MTKVLTIDRKVGRFVEARFSGNPTEQDIVEWAKAAEACLRANAARTGQGAVCCTDMRASALFRPSVTEALTNIMRADNKLVERNALLGIGGATFTMQLQRLLREAQPAGEIRRRVFVDEETLCKWLEELLTPQETARLKKFLGEFDPNGADVWRSPFGPPTPAAAMESPGAMLRAARTESRLTPASRRAEKSSPGSIRAEDERSASPERDAERGKRRGGGPKAGDH
jgi:hypothetical protein